MTNQVSTERAAQLDDFNNDVYASVTVSAILRDIKLVNCEYFIKPEVFDAIEDLENMGFSGDAAGFSHNPDSGDMLGTYRWVAEIKLGRKKVLKLVSEYLIVYTGLEGFDEFHVKCFFEKVGRFASYPYFRADFSHHTASSGIMLPPLPSLNERVN